MSRPGERWGRVKFMHNHSEWGFCRLEQRPNETWPIADLSSRRPEIVCPRNVLERLATNQSLEAPQQSLQCCTESARQSKPQGRKTDPKYLSLTLSKPQSLNTQQTTSIVEHSSAPSPLSAPQMTLLSLTDILATSA